MKITPVLLALVATVCSVHAARIPVRLPSGELILVKVESDEMAVILAQVNAEAALRDEEAPHEFVMDFCGGSSNSLLSARANLAPRNFQASLTKQEKDDITLIINSMGHASLAKLATSRSSLKKAGDRIDHIHPLKLLLTAFSDEKMKVSMHQMQNRGWVWGEFMGGLAESLEQESKAGNLKDEYIDLVASKLKIDPNQIRPIIREGKWKEFVVKLTDLVPRSGDPDRYR